MIIGGVRAAWLLEKNSALWAGLIIMQSTEVQSAQSTISTANSDFPLLHLNERNVIGRAWGCHHLVPGMYLLTVLKMQCLGSSCFGVENHKAHRGPHLLLLSLLFATISSLSKNLQKLSALWSRPFVTESVVQCKSVGL